MENGDKASEKERRVDHLINLVEKQTRTERHLEEHLDISSSPENIRHAKDVNERRQHEIDNLKDILAHGEKDNTIENTQKRLHSAGGYLNNNAAGMDDGALKSAQTKQKNRAEQLDRMK